MATVPVPHVETPPDAIHQVPLEAYPDYSHDIIEDDSPVDNFITELLLHLLTEPLYASWKPASGKRFLAVADVCLFYQSGTPSIVPDVMLSLDVPDKIFDDPDKPGHRTYYIWEVGKVPEVVIEIVSLTKGGELDEMMDRYATIRIPYYVVYDPRGVYKRDPLRVYQLQGMTYQLVDGAWLPEVGLGVKLWDGEHGGRNGTWLRWCDVAGDVIPTGAEKAKRAEQNAAIEVGLRKQIEQRAEQERQRAEQERERADAEAEKARRLAEKLRSLGIDPEA